MSNKVNPWLLTKRLNEGNYDFSKDELYELINILNSKIHNSSLKELLVFAKYIDGNKYINLIPMELREIFENIVLENSLMKTFVKMNLVNPIKYFLKRKIKEGLLEECLIISASLGNIEMFNFLLSFKKEKYPLFAGEAFESACDNGELQMAIHIIKLNHWINFKYFTNSLKHALNKNHTYIILYLFELHPSLNNIETFEHLFKNRNIPIISYLLVNNADYLNGVEKKKLLSNACADGDLELVKVFIFCGKMNIKKNIVGYNLAFENGHTHITDFIDQF